MGALVGRVVETERTRLLGIGSDGEGVPVFQPREVGIAGGVLIFVAFQLIEIAFQLRTHAAALEVETVVHHFLVGGEDAAVFAEEMVEGLELGVGVAHEPNGRIAFAAGHEVVDIDALGGRAETVDATDALHQARGVPRRVVVEDRVGAVQVDALGQHVGGDDDAIVRARCAAVVGVEVGADVVFGLSAVGRGDGEHRERVVYALDGARHGAERVGTLGEDDQQSRGVALGVEEHGVEQALEGFELRVVGIVVPLLDEPVDEQEVVAELFDVARVEVRAAILGVLPLGVLFGREGSDLLPNFGHHVGKGEAAAALFVAAVEVEEGVDVKGRAHKDGVVLPHVDHRLRVAPQVGQRGFESRETALETLDEIDLTEARQLK